MSLKEREYDANKHCGVILVDTGKHCTRTLTCKSHALSLRRQVTGRSLSFDQLLSDHRAMRALLASGKALPPPPPPPLTSTLPPPPTPVPVEGGGRKRELGATEATLHHRRRSTSPEAPPPAKKMQLGSSGGNHHRRSNSHNHHHHNHNAVVSRNSSSSSGISNTVGGGGAAIKTIKSEPIDEDASEFDLQPFRGTTAGIAAADQQHFEIKPFHANGFEVHGGGQLVEAANGGYFIKSESQLTDESSSAATANELNKMIPGDCDLGGGTKLKEIISPPIAPPAASIITVPLTMLANVMYVNGRNCILEPPPSLLSGNDENDEHMVKDGVKGRHVEVVGNGGEPRRYLTLSSGRQQRATNRLRLNVIRTEVATEQKNGSGGAAVEAEPVSAQDYPGIDTWFHQIPKPTYVNCFKLCKLGSSAVLSKRYLNIRKSLIMNMAAAGQGLTGGSPGGVAVAALNRSNSQTAAGGGVSGSSPGGGGGVEKVGSFNVERIKV